ncbi:hypothetical protein SPBR_02851 [Sporothrix brasiliensis 5110]|uniref:Uncharacterized protein n=1 Tax=Sporothrix brasiliensis 5110 TaxID=1398154 RepID=A0A0C2ITX7_9PEZI|nr:uncharacterized protein SPBR_02851 [Sporothrix brasiliensis 5110]KIH92551.1 hypothetical protein SPBR_02851 [Sporothrix brasiliensis 5110]
MAPPKAAVDSAAVVALNTKIDSALELIAQMLVLVRDVYADARRQKEAIAQTLISSDASASSSSVAWDPPSKCEALSLARDAATLARAHGTKISLLMINEPFTPSAIQKVVTEMGAPLVSLATAASECYGDRYTNHVRQELARRCASVLEQTQHLLNAIPRDGRVVPEAQRVGGAGSGGSSSRTQSKAMADRGSYTKIGILWAECDALVAFANRGIDGYLVQVVNQLADQLKDEQEELREWGDEEEGDDDIDDGGEGANLDDANVSDSGYDDDEDGGNGDGALNDNEAAQAMLDALMNTRHIPADDPHGLRPRLETALKKIRLVLLLCRAIVKRRLTKPALPALPTPTPEGHVATRLDGAVAALQTVANRFEDLAAAFYKLDAGEVDTVLGQCLEAAVTVSRQLSRPWTPPSGEAPGDAFTDWATKFESEMQVKSIEA